MKKRREYFIGGPSAISKEKGQNYTVVKRDEATQLAVQ